MRRSVWWVAMIMLPIARSTMHETAEAPAKLAVLALEAAAEYENDASAAIWIVDDRVYTTPEVIDILQTRRKPVACESKLVGDTIHLQMRSMTDSMELLQWRESQSKSLEGVSQLLRNQYASTNPDSLVDVRWSNESIIVPLSELRQWFLDYRIEFLLREIVDPDQKATSSGAVAIMRLGSVRDMLLDLEVR